MIYSKEKKSQRETSDAIEITFFNEEKPIGPMKWKVEENIVSILKSCAPWLQEKKVAEQYASKATMIRDLERVSVSEYGVKSTESRFNTFSMNVLNSLHQARQDSMLPKIQEIQGLDYLMKANKYGLI